MVLRGISMVSYNIWLKEKSIMNLPRWTQLLYLSLISLSKGDLLGLIFGIPLSYIAFYPYFKVLKWKQDQIDEVESLKK